jgi:hypothetical protein
MTNQDAATASLRELVKYVFESEGSLCGITYGELAYRIGRLNQHGKAHPRLGKVLAVMGHLLEGVENTPNWTESIPCIQSLVVDKAGRLRGLPADGISEFWSGYPQLSKEEKLNRVQVEYIDIQNFGRRWNDVLRALDLDEVVVEDASTETGNRTFGRGGESPQHKALKEYVSQHPALVGASPADSVITEYALPSLDTLDVLFKGADQWVAVEVKSKVSDNMPMDYERGLYQCVKYKAILEAMQQDFKYQVPERVEVVLVLESSLPSQYEQLAEVVNAQIIQYIYKAGEKLPS